MKVCNVDDCDREAGRPGSARGMCNMHYSRWQRAGNAPELVDFRVDADAGLIYGKRGRPAGSRDTSGYLQITVIVAGRKTLRSAHRWIWQHVHGPIPEGLQINHKNGIKTDNRVANLELVTQQNNILHSYRIGLASNAGERSPVHKLTEAEVREIRRLADAGNTPKAIARQFGISRRHTYDIANRKVWTHLEDELPKDVAV